MFEFLTVLICNYVSIINSRESPILNIATMNEFSLGDVAIPTSTTRSQPEDIYKLTGDITSRSLYVLTGPNNSNKRSLALKLQTDYPASFKRVVSHTTRQPRPLETPGIDYIYITREEFSQLIQDDKFLQYVYVGKEFKLVLRA